MSKLLEEANLREVKKDIELKATLVKHLQKNEEICTVCDGFGLRVDGGNFGVQAVEADERFPFSNNTLTFCNACYSGVRKRCVHCNELLTRGRSTCECEATKDLKQQEREQRKQEAWDKLEKIPLTQALQDYAMLYVEGYDEFVSSDDFETWVNEGKGNNPDFNPQNLRIYGTVVAVISLSATDIIENALEDLHEDVAIPRLAVEELQDFLNTWCEKQKENTLTYYMDEKVGVRYEG